MHCQGNNSAHSHTHVLAQIRENKAAHQCIYVLYAYNIDSIHLLAVKSIRKRCANTFTTQN